MPHADHRPQATTACCLRSSISCKSSASIKPDHHNHQHNSKHHRPSSSSCHSRESQASSCSCCTCLYGHLDCECKFKLHSASSSTHSGSLMSSNFISHVEAKHIKWRGYMSSPDKGYVSSRSSVTTNNAPKQSINEHLLMDSDSSDRVKTVVGVPCKSSSSSHSKTCQTVRSLGTKSESSRQQSCDYDYDCDYDDQQLDGAIDRDHEHPKTRLASGETKTRANIFDNSNKTSKRPCCCLLNSSINIINANEYNVDNGEDDEHKYHDNYDQDDSEHSYRLSSHDDDVNGQCDDDAFDDYRHGRGHQNANQLNEGRQVRHMHTNMDTNSTYTRHDHTCNGSGLRRPAQALVRTKECSFCQSKKTNMTSTKVTTSGQDEDDNLLGLMLRQNSNSNSNLNNLNSSLATNSNSSYSSLSGSESSNEGDEPSTSFGPLTLVRRQPFSGGHTPESSDTNNKHQFQHQDHELQPQADAKIAQQNVPPPPPPPPPPQAPASSVPVPPPPPPPMLHSKADSASQQHSVIASKAPQLASFAEQIAKSKLLRPALERALKKRTENQLKTSSSSSSNKFQPPQFSTPPDNGSNIKPSEYLRSVGNIRPPSLTNRKHQKSDNSLERNKEFDKELAKKQPAQAHRPQSQLSSVLARIRGIELGDTKTKHRDSPDDGRDHLERKDDEDKQAQTGATGRTLGQTGESVAASWRRQMLAKRTDSTKQPNKVASEVGEQTSEPVPVWMKQILDKRAADRDKRNDDLKLRQADKEAQKRRLAEMPTWKRRLTSMKSAVSMANLRDSPNRKS